MDNNLQAAYRAFTNIALIKYWGKRNEELFLPVTDSLSLTLDAFYTDTFVSFEKELEEDIFILNSKVQNAQETSKISRFLDLFRKKKNTNLKARVISINHVPTAAGLASSASAFSALACCCNKALGLNMSEKELSTYARQGSGSASRSLFGGFVQWHKGDEDDSTTSYAEQFQKADFDIGMLTVVVSDKVKKISSRVGMKRTVETSPFYKVWPEIVESDLEAIKVAIRNRDIDGIGEIAQRNAYRMHATTLGAEPAFTYFQEETLTALRIVDELRSKGLPVYSTMDAGPNVKVITQKVCLDTVIEEFSKVFGKDKLLWSGPGEGPIELDVKDFVGDYNG